MKQATLFQGFFFLFFQQGLAEMGPETRVDRWLAEWAGIVGMRQEKGSSRSLRRPSWC